MRWKIALAPGLLALLVAGEGGQAKPSRECRDERGKDRCSPEEHEATLKLFGAPSVDQHRAAGAVVRRVFYVTNSGSDLIAIAFIRPRGRDPALKVYLKQTHGDPPRPPMEAPVPADVWDEVVRRSAHFERRLDRHISVDASGTGSWFRTEAGTLPPCCMRG